MNHFHWKNVQDWTLRLHFTQVGLVFAVGMQRSCLKLILYFDLKRSKTKLLSLHIWLGVDFIKQFTPNTWNLRSAPILFEQIYSNMASCIFALRSTFCIVSHILGALTLYALCPTFMNPPLSNIHHPPLVQILGYSTVKYSEPPSFF
jgi:hypothetical protein